jgi:hypothetical protein
MGMHLFHVKIVETDNGFGCIVVMRVYGREKLLPDGGEPEVQEITV